MIGADCPCKKGFPPLFLDVDWLFEASMLNGPDELLRQFASCFLHLLTCLS